MKRNKNVISNIAQVVCVSINCPITNIKTDETYICYGLTYEIGNDIYIVTPSTNIICYETFYAYTIIDNFERLIYFHNLDLIYNINDIGVSILISRSSTLWHSSVNEKSIFDGGMFSLTDIDVDTVSLNYKYFLLFLSFKNESIGVSLDTLAVNFKSNKLIYNAPHHNYYHVFESELSLLPIIGIPLIEKNKFLSVKGFLTSFKIKDSIHYYILPVRFIAAVLKEMINGFRDAYYINDYTGLDCVDDNKIKGNEIYDPVWKKYLHVDVYAKLNYKKKFKVKQNDIEKYTASISLMDRDNICSPLHKFHDPRSTVEIINIGEMKFCYLSYDLINILGYFKIKLDTTETPKGKIVNMIKKNIIVLLKSDTDDSFELIMNRAKDNNSEEIISRYIVCDIKNLQEIEGKKLTLNYFKKNIVL